MAPAGFKLDNDTVHVKGRSTAKAQELLELADERGVDPALIVTTSVGYLVPKALVEAASDDEADDQNQAPADPADADGDQTDAGDTPDAELEAYDPSKHTVDEVVEYLGGVDEAERARVIAAEKESAKPRKGVLELADTGEETK